MIYLPYPLPEPERSQLIAAGRAACALPLNTPEREEASRGVRKVLAGIELAYGYEKEAEE